MTQIRSLFQAKGRVFTNQMSELEKIRDDLAEVLNSVIMSDTVVDSANNYQDKRNKVVDAYNKIQGVLNTAPTYANNVKNYADYISSSHYTN